MKIVDDLKKNFENWEDFFNNKAGDEERFKIKPKGKLRIPELKPEDSELESNIKPVLESDWEFEVEFIDGYTKIEKKDNFYRNLSGNELYSGHTNPSMSYPVRGDFYRNFNENAQFYPLNDDITLVIEQGNRIGYVDKKEPGDFNKIKRNTSQNIQDYYNYRVFFYTDTNEFSIS